MKENVDLTLHRDFIKPPDFDAMFRRLLSWQRITLENGEVVEFEEVEIEETLNGASKYTLPDSLDTGNARQREEARARKKYEGGVLCERCGCVISKKPWEREFLYDICRSCEKILEAEWGYKFGDEFRDSDHSPDRIAWRNSF